MKFEINNQNEFMFGGERFCIDTSPGPNRRPSDDYAYTLVKTPAFLKIYSELADSVDVKTILELGVFQGGSFVLIDKMFKPDRMSAVDISAREIPPLEAYVKRVPNRNLHLRTSQDDAEVLQSIVDLEFDGQLDMVIDDCSHRYDLTRRSFELLFPRLSAGGLYIIEDWSWAHGRGYQTPDHPISKEPALTNLIFELIVLQGSSSRLIENIFIHQAMVVIKKGDDMTRDFWGKMIMRDRKLPQI